MLDEDKHNCSGMQLYVHMSINTIEWSFEEQKLLILNDRYVASYIL